MRIGKIALMGGVAAIAMITAAGAKSANSTAKIADIKDADKPLVLAQNSPSSSTSSMSNAELAARLQALEDALSNRDERAQADRTRLSTLEQQYNYASWTYDNGRPTILTGDGRFTMSFRTRFQSDFAVFSQDQQPASFGGPRDLSSGAVIRRAYFGIEGKAYSDFAYEFRLNLGGSGVEGADLSKAVVHYIGIPNWHFSMGVLEPAFMFEGTTSSGNLIFLERPEIDNIGQDIFGAGDARRGIEVGWAKSDVLWAGDNINATIYFTGNKTQNAAGHGNGGDEQSQLLGRFADRIWSNGLSNLSVGMSIAHIFNSGTGSGQPAINLQDRPQNRVDGTRLVSTGNITAQTADLIAFDMGGNYENFFLGGEWAQFTLDRQCGTITSAGNPLCTSSTAVIDHPTFEGWYVEGSWIITGETRPYTPNSLNNETGGFQQPVPSRPFSLRGDSWGAWELVARYSSVDLNWNPSQTATASRLAGVVGGKETIFDIGINWYMNRNVKLLIHDSFVSVEKGTAALPTRDNQDLNILGVRLQFSN
ncbi:MAG TPA: porin [Rhizomicrobium sp.]|nr:porin [Rhizomicrobium sp.]